jgi:hypothetical protein
VSDVSHGFSQKNSVWKKRKLIQEKKKNGWHKFLLTSHNTGNDNDLGYYELKTKHNIPEVGLKVLEVRW